MAYLKTVLFVYSEEGAQYRQKITENPFGCEVTSCTVQELRQQPDPWVQGFQHIVVAAELEVIKEIILRVKELDLSIAFLPLPWQKMLRKCFAIPANIDGMIELALSDATTVPFDLLFCNDHLVLFKATIGRLPLVDSLIDEGRLHVIREGLRKLVNLHLLPFTIETKGEKEMQISTAATGCLVLETPDASFASKMIGRDCSYHDGMISMLLLAPFSIMDYFKLMLRRLFMSAENGSSLAPSVGYIKSREINIRSNSELSIFIDGERRGATPASFRVEPCGIGVHVGREAYFNNQVAVEAKEKIAIGFLPSGKELQKAFTKRIPFFTYASEERFKDLFLALRDDSRLDSTYVVLMILSTVLATVGLYLNSGSVIIGAMLIAPLMAPIISFAMGLLRFDRGLVNRSLIKIVVGIVLALFTSLLFSLCSPYQPLTAEMLGRLNPTVLDLIVAIVAGIAGAYTKSFKEILQSLAGVAIAVALVPPLAVSGIGIGRLDFSFFIHAFLLFLTNFFGIVVAATMTFRVLGYSPVVRDRKGLLLVTLFFCLLLIPLSLSFQGMVKKAAFEGSWRSERFLVNGKYLIVKDATLQTYGTRDVLIVQIHARDPLTRADLTEFRRKVRYNFDKNILIRATVTYIP